MSKPARTVAQQVQIGLRKLPEEKAAEVLDFVEFLLRRCASTEVISRPLSRAHTAAADPQDVLMEDHDALRALYAEFVEEDRELAQIGLAHYAQVLRQEEAARL